MSLANSLKRWWTLRGFWAERPDFYRDVARSLERKELLRDFVEGELEISLNPITADKARAEGLKYMRDVIESGSVTLVDVLQATMPADDRMALGTMRTSSKQTEGLRHLANTIEEQKKLTKVIYAALFAPMVLVPIGFIFAFVVATVVFPEFAAAAPPEVWKGFNLVLRLSADFVAKVGPWIMAAVAAFSVWMFAYGFSNLTADWRYEAEKARGLKAFLWSLAFPGQFALRMYRDIQGTKMLTDLAFILQTGALLSEALETMAADAQPWMKKHLYKILDHLRDYPSDYVGAFSHGILSPFLTGRIHSTHRLDSRGKFDLILVEIGSKGQEDARESVRRSATKINTILLALTLGTILYFYGGQMVVLQSIQDATSPSAVMKEEAGR